MQNMHTVCEMMKHNYCNGAMDDGVVVMGVVVLRSKPRSRIESNIFTRFVSLLQNLKSGSYCLV